MINTEIIRDKSIALKFQIYNPKRTQFNLFIRTVRQGNCNTFCVRIVHRPE